MFQSSHLSNDPSSPRATRRVWQTIAVGLVRYGVVYCIFGVCGILFLLGRGIALLFRGPGDSGI